MRPPSAATVATAWQQPSETVAQQLPVAIASPEQRALACKSRCPADQQNDVVTEGGRLLLAVIIVPAHLHLIDQAIFVWVFALDIGFVEEYVFHRRSETACNPECYFQGGRILAGLDRHDRLTAHADVFRQLLLRHLTVPESKLPNNVSKGHDSPSPAVQTERHGGGGDLRCSHTGQ